MKPSESNAAKSGGVNGKLSKLYGTPYNASNCSGGRSTQAAGRPTTNASVVKSKWGESPNDYGKGV